MTIDLLNPAHLLVLLLAIMASQTLVCYVQFKEDNSEKTKLIVPASILVFVEVGMFLVAFIKLIINSL